MFVPRTAPTVQAATNCLPTIIVCSVFLGLAWISFSLRIWTRLSIVKTVGWDDATMAVAVVFFTIYCAAVIDISTRVTTNHEIVSLNALLISVNFLTVAEVFYILTLLMLKISLGIFFLRLTIEKWQRIIIYIAVTVSTVFSIAMFFFAVFQCGIYHGALDFVTKRLLGQCVSDASALGMVYTHGAVTTLTDWCFLVMPIFILRESLMNRNEKVTVGSILMFATIGGIASIIRFKFIHGLAVPKEEFFANARDIAIWSCVEPGAGIIAGSLVTLRPLARRAVIFFQSWNAYGGSRFPQRPYMHETQSSTHLRAPETPATVFLEPPSEIDEIIAINEAAVVEGGGQRKPPSRTRSSGLPLNLFGSNTSSMPMTETRLPHTPNAPPSPPLPPKDCRVDNVLPSSSPKYRPKENDNFIPEARSRMQLTKKKRSSGLPLNMFGSNALSSLGSSV